MLQTACHIAYLPHMLGNRLRSLAASMLISEVTQRNLQVFWNVNRFFPLEYHKVFETELSLIDDKELLDYRASKDFGLYSQISDWHGIKNEMLHGRPWLGTLAEFHAPRQVDELFENSLEGQSLLYTNNFHRNFSFLDQCIRMRKLRFLESIRESASRIVRSLNLSNVPSVHARGTDFVPHQQNGTDPLQYFLDQIFSRVPSDGPFYLSTEDRGLKDVIKSYFGNRVISRGDVELPKLGNDGYLEVTPASTLESIIDMLVLSATDLVVFHPASSFAQLSLIYRGTLADSP